MEHYPALLREEILIRATTYMALEDIMLSGISKKDKYCMIHLYESI